MSLHHKTYFAGALDIALMDLDNVLLKCSQSDQALNRWLILNYIGPLNNFSICLFFYVGNFKITSISKSTIDKIINICSKLYFSDIIEENRLKLFIKTWFVIFLNF